jgi:hypothetical protein
VEATVQENQDLEGVVGEIACNCGVIGRTISTSQLRSLLGRQLKAITDRFFSANIQRDLDLVAYELHVTRTMREVFVPYLERKGTSPRIALDLRQLRVRLDEWESSSAVAPYTSAISDQDVVFLGQAAISVYCNEVRREDATSARIIDALTELQQSFYIVATICRLRNEMEN